MYILQLQRIMMVCVMRLLSLKIYYIRIKFCVGKWNGIYVQRVKGTM